MREWEARQNSGRGVANWWQGVATEGWIIANCMAVRRVLLRNGGFFNTCPMKRCLHGKVDFKTNALNNAHVSQLLNYKAGLLQNDGIIKHLQIQVTEQKLANCLKQLHFLLYM